jgi:hypothetical protein
MSYGNVIGTWLALTLMDRRCELQPNFLELENRWLQALQASDLETLERLLDPAFVCVPWSSKGELLLKRDYLNEARRGVFKGCDVSLADVQLHGDYALVRCRILCEYHIAAKTWELDITVNDIWVNRQGDWKALNRKATASSAPIGSERDSVVQQGQAHQELPSIFRLASMSNSLRNS